MAEYKSRIKSAVKSAQDISLQLFFPHRCGGCDRRGTLFCETCLLRIRQDEAPVRGIEGLDMFFAAGAFAGPLREAVHKLKYSNDVPLARPLAALLADTLVSPQGAHMGEQQPVLFAVPLHPSRVRSRGYNQSMELVRELGRLTGWSVGHGLVRERQTRAQVGLSALDRRSNVEGAFRWTAGDAPDYVLLVDDVCTTGSTLAACASVLRDAGATRVDGCAVALAAGPEYHTR